MRYEIKELHVGGILDQAIQLSKNHFQLLFSITLVLMVPVGIATGFLVAFAVPPLDPNNPPAPGAEMQRLMAPGMGWFGLVLMLNLIVVYPLTNAAMIHAIANTYLERPASVGDSFRRALSVLLPLVGTGILLYFAIVGGMMLCIIPGIIAAFVFFLTMQVVVIEGIYGFSALRRSRLLMKGNIGTAFVLGFLLFLIQIGMSVVSQLIPQQYISAIVNTLVQAVIFVFVSAAWVVFYFSCRCKAEHFDLTMLADAVGRDGPSTDAPGPVL